MRAWEESEERRSWLRRAEPLIHEEKVNVLTGLETWFTRPSKPGEPAPPRYKMVVVTGRGHLAGGLPLITLILVLFAPLLGLLPMLLRTLVLTAIMVTLMTYVIMPRMTCLFSSWLYLDRE